MCGIGVFFKDYDAYNVSLKIENNSKVLTSSAAELMAAIHALEKALSIMKDEKIEFDKVFLISDSRYLVDSMNSWIYNWAKNNWMTAKKKPVAHKDKFLKILQLKQEFPEETKIVWEHVKGHSHSPGNKVAHQLAFNAANS